MGYEYEGEDTLSLETLKQLFIDEAVSEDEVTRTRVIAAWTIFCDWYDHPDNPSIIWLQNKSYSIKSQLELDLAEPGSGKIPRQLATFYNTAFRLFTTDSHDDNGLLTGISKDRLEHAFVFCWQMESYLESMDDPDWSPDQIDCDP